VVARPPAAEKYCRIYRLAHQPPEPDLGRVTQRGELPYATPPWMCRYELFIVGSVFGPDRVMVSDLTLV
jgi:hypothetical protein